MKLVFLLWGDGRGLREPGLHERLAAAGVRRLQVNVDDEHVAPGLRLQSSDTPVAAVVSAWTDGDADEVCGVLGGAAVRVAGYEVDERRPLEPPEVEDGSRADALANVAVLRRPDVLDPAEWRRIWLEEHTPVAIATQATFGYVQDVVVRAVTPDAPRVDAIVEELFPMAALTDVHAFYGSGGDDTELSRRMTTLMESVARMGADRDLDLVPTSRYVFAL